MRKTNPKAASSVDGDQDFDYLDVMKRCRAMTKNDDKHRMSYVEWHSNWKIPSSGIPKKPALYAGTSDKRVTQRFPEHDECLEDPDAVGAGAFRYTYCRGSKEMMRIIFAAYKESEFRNLAEQILINLFEIQAPIVKKADLASSRFSLEPDATSNLEKRSWLGCLEDRSDLTSLLESAE